MKANTVRLSIAMLGVYVVSAQDFTATLTASLALPPNGSSMDGRAELTLNGNGAVWTQIWVSFGTERDTVQIFRSSNASELGAPLFVVPAVGVIGPGLTTPGGELFQASLTFDQGQLADLYAGNMWVNVSTPDFPNGEVRGQIIGVPEPAPIALMATAGGWLFYLSLRRWKRRAANFS